MPPKLPSEALTDAQLEELVALGLTDSELSSLLGISETRWKLRYTSVLKRGRARLRQSLRKAQIKAALSGNASLLTWLGKQYLGQRDRLESQVSAEHRAISITPNVLERLQHSYKLTLEQVRTRGALSDEPAPAREEAPRGVPGDREGSLKTAALLRNSDSEASDDGGRGEL